MPATKTRLEFYTRYNEILLEDMYSSIITVGGVYQIGLPLTVIGL